MAYILATSRWGTQFGVPPLYICDALLAAAIAHHVTGSHLRRRGGRAALRGDPGFAVVLALGYVIGRLAASGPLSITSLRDSVPYLYLIVAFLAASSYRASTSNQRLNTLKAFNAALLFHLGWVAIARFIPSLSTQEVTSGDAPAIAIFRIRTDFDATLVGVTVAWYLMRLLRGDLRHPVLGWLIVAGGAGLVLSLNSRAGLLAMGLCLALTLTLFLLGPFRASRSLAVAAIAPLVLVAGMALLPMTPAGAKLLGGFGLGEQSGVTQPLGVGTQRARSEAWQRVIAYTGDDVTRQVVGVGFGENFMSTSGAIVPLVGYNAADVRSPHNWFVGTYARLGYVGVALFAGVYVQLMAVAIGLRRRLAADDLLLLAVLAMGAITVAAALGVIMESPFGAIPFFWFAGVLLSRPTLMEPVRLTFDPNEATPREPAAARTR